MANHILGVDISKDTFDVALLPAALPAGLHPERPKHRTFPNRPAGFRTLARWLAHQQVPKVWACLEATSTYGEALAEFLHQQGHTLSVVNPLQIKHYADSELSRTKTDRTDAAVIARFCRAHQPLRWTPPAPELRELQALCRRRQQLEAMLTQESNRLSAPGLSKAEQASLRKHCRALERLIADLALQTQEHLHAHPALAAQRDLLCSIPGIGDKTALCLLAEMGDVNRFDSTRQAAAYAGLVPAHRDSGSSLHGKPRLAKRGNAQLRKALYFPAVVAAQHNPILRPFYQRLLAAGKSKMQALGAVMHKLLRIAVAILRSARPFDPNYRSSHS